MPNENELPGKWARVFVAARLTAPARTRRGAWYRVVSAGRSRVVLDVYGNRVDVPMTAVEVRAAAPDKFTVVYRPRDESLPAHAHDSNLGRIYAVCPKCSARLRVYGEPREAECAECGHTGVIAWWETG